MKDDDVFFVEDHRIRNDLNHRFDFMHLKHLLGLDPGTALGSTQVYLSLIGEIRETRIYPMVITFPHTYGEIPRDQSNPF